MSTVRVALAQALSSIRGNPLRASLAGLAMAAAVATTALVITGLDSLARSARETSERAFGSQTFVIARVFGTGLSRTALAEKLQRNQNMSRADLRFLERYADGQVRYAAIAQRTADVAADGRTFEAAAVNGASASLAEIRDIAVERGRYFSRPEELQAAQVAVVGAGVQDVLFPARDPVGQSLRIAGRRFTIIGVQERQGTAGGVSLDRYVWIPYPAYERIFGAPASLQLFVRGVGDTVATEAEERARASMRARRRLAPGVEDTFDLLAPEAARDFVSRISEQVGAAGAPISAMALLGAIIVVANTTLVSVAQRTREIGIRRAVGASARTIVHEVLAEAALVSMGGALAGLLVAVVVLRLAAQALGAALPLELSTIAFSVGAAMLSGLLAGWYPARRAARLDVITALHAD